MDKILLNELIKFGLVTNIDVDPNKYEDVDDLINKGVVTIPGAKSKILEIMEKLNITETAKVPEEVIKVKEEEVIKIEEVDETEAPTEEIVDAVEVIEETTTEETVTEEAPVEEVVEEPVEKTVETTTEETVTEEAPVEEPVKKAKKTSKKSE